MARATDTEAVGSGEGGSGVGAGGDKDEEAPPKQGRLAPLKGGADEEEAEAAGTSPRGGPVTGHQNRDYQDLPVLRIVRPGGEEEQQEQQREQEEQQEGAPSSTATTRGASPEPSPSASSLTSLSTSPPRRYRCVRFCGCMYAQGLDRLDRWSDSLHYL